MIASVLRRGHFHDPKIELALPERAPLPGADIRQIRIGVGSEWKSDCMTANVGYVQALFDER